MMKITHCLLLLSVLLTAGCSQESKLVKKANSTHQLRAHWNMKKYLSTGAPKDYDLTVWEKGESFRIESKTKYYDYGAWKNVSDDILFDGSETIYFIPIKSERKPQKYVFKDMHDLGRFRFWRIDNITYTKAGEETVEGQNCLKLTAFGQGVGGINLDLTRWISTNLGYLMKSTTTSGGEHWGTDLLCDKVELRPTYPPDCFTPPTDCEVLTRPMPGDETAVW